MGGGVALWYTLAMYLDGAACEFEYVWIRVCAAVFGGARARVRCVFVCLCECMGVSLTLSL
jgi:hypothetical protein